MGPTPGSSDSSAGLGRRFGALFYDSFVLLGMLFIAALPLPWFDQITEGGLSGLWIKRVYLLSVCFGYFGGFWVHGGQTLGMKAWRIRVIRLDGCRLGWIDALKRFFGLCLSTVTLGLGFFWALTNTERSTWQDALSQTCVLWCPGPSKGTLPPSNS